MIDHLIKEGFLHPIDLFFAERMGAKNINETLLLATLMAVSREGHLCLDVSEKVFSLTDKTALELTRALQTGAETFENRRGVKCFESCFYLEKNYAYESRILFHVKRLVSKASFSPYESGDLNKEQQAAVKKCLEESFCIISGGPGTGKTHITRHLIKALGPLAKVVLCAPTGKAASRLQQMNPGIECRTLHSLLGIQSERDLHREGGYISADLLVIDECSMVDAPLFSYLVSSIHQGTRVVLLGDVNQLPSVGSGSIFADLVDLVPTAKLTHSMRSDQKGILDLASAVNEGLEEAVLPFLSPLDISQDLQQMIPLPSKLLDEDLKKFDRIRFLSCVNEGPFGVYAVNQKILEKVMQNVREGDFYTVPIIITRTDYKLGLYNGETGVLVHTHLQAEYALFPSITGGVRKFLVASLPSYELAYCLSVHKSQGSEFEHVVLLVPAGSESFGREILYTGVTRAKKSITIQGDMKTLKVMLQKRSRKCSGLKKRLENC